MARRTLIALACFLVCLPAPGQFRSTDPRAQNALWMALVDSIANKALKRPLLGIAVAVAADDRIVFDRGYGYADLSRSTPVGSQTVFHVASISKNIAAATLLQLADQGKLSLDEDITRSIANAPVHGKHITVLQLLNHTSGIPSFTSLPDADQNETKDLSHDQVLDLLKDVPPGFDPGTSWRYNNTGFYLAGMVVENVTHSAYGAYLHDRIFTPLEMRSSSLCDASTPVPNLAAGSEVADGKLTAAKPMTWKVPFAAGGVCATASDLLRWQIALNKNHIVSKRSLALMRTPTVLADGTSIDYGLGTRIGLLDGHKVFGQTGSGGGYTAVLETFPDDHVSIAVLINTASEGAATDMAGQIARAVLGTQNFPLRDLAIPPEELSCIPGVYESDEGSVRLLAADGKIHFELEGSSGVKGTITRQGEYSYAIDEDRRVRFRCSPGRSRWSLVYSGGLMTDAKRAREKP